MSVFKWGVYMTTISDFSSIFFSSKVMKRAIKVAVIVGTILAFINHGDTILAGDLTSVCWTKMALSTLVPYIVAPTTATLGIIEARQNA